MMQHGERPVPTCGSRLTTGLLIDSSRNSLARSAVRLTASARLVDRVDTERHDILIIHAAGLAVS